MVHTDPNCLSPRDIAILKEYGTLLDTANPAMIRTSASFSVPNSQIMQANSDGTSEVPEMLESVEGLLYIGLTSSSAVNLLKSYQDRCHRTGNPDELIEYVECYLNLISYGGDSSWCQLADEEVLEKLGVRQETIIDILDPNHSPLCDRDHLKSRLMAKLRAKFDALKQCLDKLKQQAILYTALRGNQEKAEAFDSMDASTSSTSETDAVHGSS